MFVLKTLENLRCRKIRFIKIEFNNVSCMSGPCPFAISDGGSYYLAGFLMNCVKVQGTTNFRWK